MIDDSVRKHAATVFSYLFGIIGKYEYRNRIGDRQLAKELWSKVSNNGYMLVNCKLFAYAHHVAKANGTSVSPARYEIQSQDVRLLRNLDLSKVKTTYKVYSLFDFKTMESAFVASNDMDTYIGKFISKKLRFLCNSYGVKRSELHADLQCAAVYALRKQYPAYESELHALNICKTAIQNSGQGMIEYWTRDKRNALINDGNGFQAVHVQLEFSNSAVMPEHEDEFRVNMQSLVAVTEKLPPNQQSWVKTASGLHDPGFSFFIGKDNSDAVDSMPYDRYLRLVCDYHRMPKDTMINSLRAALA